MLGFLINAAADVVVSTAVSTIISYQSGAFDADIQSIKDYVDAKADSFLSRKR
jgi:hypothetical protein